jgi:hypothetical protein
VGPLRLLVTVVLGLYFVVLLLFWAPGLAVLKAFTPAFMVVGAIVLIAIVVVWGLVPYWIYQKIIQAADLERGPLLNGLHWWLGGTYSLMVALLLGVLLLNWPSTRALEKLAEYHVFLWLPAMLIALAPAWVGFRSRQKTHGSK